MEDPHPALLQDPHTLDVSTLLELLEERCIPIEEGVWRNIP